MYAHILCIDDNNEFLFNLRASLKYKYQVSTAINYELAAQVITQNPVDLVFLDVKLGEGESGIRLIQKMKELDPSLV
ncbi:MAG TPA: response regulator, partial [bacterium]|nr:response regulator [bacterium]